VFLAGVFLTADASHSGDTSLADSLRARTLAVGGVTGLIVFAGLYPVIHDAPTLAAGLRTQAFPLLAVALVAGVATLVLVSRRHFAAARFSAAAAVGSVITGWGVGQYPWMLVDTLTITQAAGAAETLQALLIVVALAGVIVLPSLGYLLWLTQTEQWTRS
jgi:cytochrome d ubiquinol oxidase subunit II